MPGRPKKTVAKKPVVKKAEPKPVVVDPVVVAEEEVTVKPEGKRPASGSKTEYAVE
jgi:hypothetical protein